MKISELQKLKSGCLLATTDNTWICIDPIKALSSSDPHNGCASGKFILLFLEYNFKWNYIKALLGESVITIHGETLEQLHKVS